MFRPQKASRGDTFLVRFTENKGGLGNSSASIDVNAFHTTNFWSQSAMRGAENRGNTHCDGPTHIHSIANIPFDQIGCIAITVITYTTVS